MKTKTIKIQNIEIGGSNPLVLIAGPCVIENEKSALEHAAAIKEIAGSLNMPFIFKSSYDKANRTSINSFRGPGLKKGLQVLAKIKKQLNLTVLSDVHNINEVKAAADVLDIIQIPAFLCRQTDLLVAVAKTKKAVNVKKGQFLSPDDVKNIIKKLEQANNKNILITERGTSFGYNNLVSDMRALPIMRGFGYPIIFDATHSVQLPGGARESSGGQREFVDVLTRAAVAVGCEGIFLEVHKNPDTAPCDSANMIALDKLKAMLLTVQKIDALIRR